MFENIGGTIKAMAKVFWWIGTITIVGILLIWPFAFVLYGFGELVEKTCDIERNTGMIMKPEELKKARKRSEAEAKKAEEEQKHRIKLAEEENLRLIYCPDCDEELAFDKNLTDVECPYCGCNIQIK